MIMGKLKVLENWVKMGQYLLDTRPGPSTDLRVKRSFPRIEKKNDVTNLLKQGLLPISYRNPVILLFSHLGVKISSTKHLDG